MSTDFGYRKSEKIRRNKQPYQRQIEATDRQIDALVYELYGLTREKIEIVKSAIG